MQVRRRELGPHWAAAGGERLKHYGSCSVPLHNSGCEDIAHVKFTVLNVRRPILSVGKSVKQGYRVHCGTQPFPCTVTGEGLPLTRRGNVDLFKALLDVSMVTVIDRDDTRY